MSTRPVEPANPVAQAEPNEHARPIVLAKVERSIDHLFNESPGGPMYRAHIETVSVICISSLKTRNAHAATTEQASFYPPTKEPLPMTAADVFGFCDPGRERHVQ